LNSFKTVQSPRSKVQCLGG